MSWKWKILSLLIFVVVMTFGVFTFYPRGASLVMSYTKECRVSSIEPFLKGISLSGSTQMNKMSLACDDGFVCRTEDTGFAAVKVGNMIEFRGFPEYASFEEWGKCDHAVLKRIISQ